MSRRSAFTLLELLLVIAILAALATMTMPKWGMLLNDRRLARAGDQVRGSVARLRVEAMRSGRVIMLEGMLEGTTLRAKPFYSASDATEAIDQTGSGSELLTGADQASAVVIEQDEAAIETIELPDEIVVKSVSVVSAARAMEIEQLTVSDQGQGWSRPVLFYPDGSTSTALISLSHPTMGRVVVKIRGITGDATVSGVLAP
ncbi:type II secretion system GspH family protein [Rubripirellula sp.]|nr:type II secretion system protein [Rubripirellula sp.]MDB4749355.1 type II secretion system GspH family protein [Rubripirellula sp.]